MGLLILFLLIAVIAGTIIAQIYLSLKENRLMGMILPFFTFGLSMLVFFSVLVFSYDISTVVVTDNGVTIEQPVSTPAFSTTTDFVRAAFLFLYCNIPTLLLLAIYAACGGKRNRLRERKKLEAQDYY